MAEDAGDDNDTEVPGVIEEGDDCDGHGQSLLRGEDDDSLAFLHVQAERRGHERVEGEVDQMEDNRRENCQQEVANSSYAFSFSNNLLSSNHMYAMSLSFSYIEMLMI